LPSSRTSAELKAGEVIFLQANLKVDLWCQFINPILELASQEGMPFIFGVEYKSVNVLFNAGCFQYAIGMEIPKESLTLTPLSDRLSARSLYVFPCLVTRVLV
jgi:hypothetical protein